jgi:hypothetical protein
MRFFFFRDMAAVSRRPSAAGRLLLPIAFLVSAQTNGQSLRQAFEPQLARLSSKSHSAVLFWDLTRSETLAAVRPEVFDAPRCLGSLLKPFLLMAYLNERCGDVAFRLPELPPCPRWDGLADPQTSRGSGINVELRPCTGRATSQCPVECWYKPGHGKLDMSRALALSCNQYFYQLSKQTSPEAFLRTLAGLALSPSRALTGATSVAPETMIGLDSGLRLVPLQVLKAYGVLISGHPSAEIGTFGASASLRAILLEGLRLGAVEGTSAMAQQALPPNHHLLGKTGTSPAFTGGRYLKSRTDGWFLGFYPAAQPVLAVMVYYPGGLGARDAAPLGGQAIKMYLEMVR